MSYYSARKPLDQNLELLSGQRDLTLMVLWNLTKGLLELIKTLQSDIADIQSKLQRK
jgi:hypothetical protein